MILANQCVGIIIATWGAFNLLNTICDPIFIPIGYVSTGDEDFLDFSFFSVK